MRSSIAFVIAAAVSVQARAGCRADFSEDYTPQRVLEDPAKAVTTTSAAASPSVTLPYEIHVGKLTNDSSRPFYTFANVPYAKPPNGTRRFAKPEYPDTIAKDKDKPINEGSSYRVCHQANGGWFKTAESFIGAWTKLQDLSDYTSPPTDTSPKDPPKQLENASEDCLLLDVVVPKALVDANLDEVYPVPVVVWFHGGGFIFGHKNLFNPPWGLFNASQINATDADNAVIYVTANYRLGAFGFLTSPEYIDQKGEPNAGFHDQALVLQWVKDNILSFGGDPYRVTVVGESAGASSILHHITAYGGPSRRALFRPPFQRAILQSPAFFPESSDKQEKAIYKEFLRQAGSSDLDALKAAPEEKLEFANRNMSYNSPYGLFAFGPAVDGEYVPFPLSLALKYGKYWRDVEVFIAHNGNEGLLFTPPWIQTDDLLKKHVKTVFPDIPSEDVDTVLKIYPAPEKGGVRANIQRVADALGEVAVVCNAAFLLNGFPKQWTSKYVFDLSPSIHGQDCLYTYDNGTNNPDNPLAPGVRTRNIATFMQNYIVNFARFGDPNGEYYDDYKSTPAWLPRLPNYEKGKVGSFSRALITLLGKYEEVDDKWYNKTRCDFWADAPYWQPEEVSRLEL